MSNTEVESLARQLCLYGGLDSLIRMMELSYELSMKLQMK